MKVGTLSHLFVPKLPINRKLSPIIAGRTIEALEQDGPLALVRFTDGSQMHIKTGAPAPSAELPGRALKTVRQAGTRLEFVFEDSTSLAITLAEATSSVLLRNARGDLEYAD